MTRPVLLFWSGFYLVGAIAASFLGPAPAMEPWHYAFRIGISFGSGMLFALAIQPVRQP